MQKNGIYEKYIANIILNETECFPAKVRNEARIFALLFNFVLKVLAHAI